MAIKLEQVAADSETVAHSRLVLARIALARGRPHEALDLAGQAMAVYQAQPGVAHERMLDARVLRAAALRIGDDRDAAAAELAAATAFMAGSAEVNAAQRVDYWLELGRQALSRGDRGAASAALDQAQALAAEAGGAARRDIEDVRRELDAP
jgi:hypothetical protein